MVHPIRSLILCLPFLLASFSLANAQIIPSNQATGCASCAASGNYDASGGDKTQCGHYGLKIYPLSDQRYIKQFCQPTICPGSCFGVFKQQWNRWDQACPNWHAGNADALIGAGNYSPNLNNTAYNQPSMQAPSSLKTPDTIPPALPKTDTEIEPKIPPESTTPLPEPKKVTPNDPRPSVPQTSSIPMQMPSEASVRSRNMEYPTVQPITLPPIPDVRIKH